MSNLGVENQALTTQEVGCHALSSLIAKDDGESVVVSVASLAEAILTDMSEIHRNGNEIAASCSEKFKRCRSQPHMDWVVVYMPELRCFVGVRRRHKSLR